VVTKLIDFLKFIIHFPSNANELLDKTMSGWINEST